MNDDALRAIRDDFRRACQGYGVNDPEVHDAFMDSLRRASEEAAREERERAAKIADGYARAGEATGDPLVQQGSLIATAIRQGDR